jgi:uncharacterized membrane protein
MIKKNKKKRKKNERRGWIGIIIIIINSEATGCFSSFLNIVQGNFHSLLSHLEQGVFSEDISLL